MEFDKSKKEYTIDDITNQINNKTIKLKKYAKIIIVILIINLIPSIIMGIFGYFHGISSSLICFYECGILYKAAAFKEAFILFFILILAFIWPIYIIFIALIIEKIIDIKLLKKSIKK